MDIRKRLAHPLARGLDPEGPRALDARRRILAEKPALRALYAEWYGRIAAALPPVDGPVLELGAGFPGDAIPRLISVQPFPCAGTDLVLEARSLPFPAGSLRAIVIIDRLHHFPDVGAFFREAARCVRSSGALLIIEPWVSKWSRLLYSRFHDEPFLPDAEAWELPPGCASNIALPWMVFERDRARFETEFPEWRVERVEGMMPLSYLLTGGVSLRALAPGSVIQAVRWMEKRLPRWEPAWAAFAFVEVRRI